MKVLLIRHGETAGNLEKRYVGSRTDEGLTETEKDRLQRAGQWIERVLYAGGGTLPESVPHAGSGTQPETDWYAQNGILLSGCAVTEIYLSPMRRCRETAELLLPPDRFSLARRIEVPGLKECDFGKFEYKNYMELNGDADYQRFIDSGGTDGFPGGERIQDFRARCVRTFGGIVEARLKTAGKEPEEFLVFVVHGGTIMSVMEALAVPGKDYFSWQPKNGCGYLASVTPDVAHPFGFSLTNIAKFSVL